MHKLDTCVYSPAGLLHSWKQGSSRRRRRSAELGCDRSVAGGLWPGTPLELVTDDALLFQFFGVLLELLQALPQLLGINVLLACTQALAHCSRQLQSDVLACAPLDCVDENRSGVSKGSKVSLGGRQADRVVYTAAERPGSQRASNDADHTAQNHAVRIEHEKSESRTPFARAFQEVL